MGCCAATNPQNQKNDEIAEKTVDIIWTKYDKDGNGYLDQNEVKGYV